MNNNWKKIFFISLFIGGFVSLFASSDPDGLNKVAEEKGFLGQGSTLFSGAIPDYSFPGIANPDVAKSLAGVIGIVLVFFVLYFAGKLLHRRKEPQKK
ncbi:MAG: PDGLE domain-containing protein [Candidatus Pacebacteria bacterium]|jgi:cobalt/nickel transport protein|nr:PDGLE domain-containing protein [Candidatus Paceibacterota bacterium]